MDPLTAFSLAASVFQVIDFTTRLACNSYKIYKSATGALADHVSVEAATLRLTSLSEAIQASDQTISPGPSSNPSAESALHDIAKESLAIAKELNDVLQGLKTSKGSKFGSARVALKAVIKQKRLDDLEVKLARCRQELLLNFVLIIQSDFGSLGTELATIRHDNIAGHKQTQLELQDAVDRIVTVIKESKYDSAKDVDMDALTSQLGQITIGSVSEQAFLDDLYLPVLEWRERQIVKAADNTFDWIFDPVDGVSSPNVESERKDDVSEASTKIATEEMSSVGDIKNESQSKRGSTGFEEWLSSGDGIFWITGKPGCGKSTLMKFITKDERTYSALERWADQAELVTASAYFWISGDPRERSLLGLWRSLFYCILIKQPGLIRVLFPWRWRTYENAGSCSEGWNEDEFLQALERLSTNSAQGFKFCFFIDGLDEFEGDHRKLTMMLKGLVQNNNVKLCVSSRPWEVFRSLFATVPTVQVHEWTWDDIEEFVTQELATHPLWNDLVEAEPAQAEDLKKTISGHSEGVFLWVHLVIQEMKRALDEGDDISNLLGLLETIPTDLDRFFERMLSNLSERHLRETKEFLSFMITYSKNGPSPKLPEFAYVEERALNFGEVAPFEILSPPTILSKYAALARRIQSRCRDLLEVLCVFPMRNNVDGRIIEGLDETQTIELWEYELSVVKFVHRSVADFLLTSGSKYASYVDSSNQMQEFVGTQRWRAQFVLAEVKRIPIRLFSRSIDMAPQTMRGFLFNSGRFRGFYGEEESPFEYVEALEKAVDRNMGALLPKWSVPPTFDAPTTFLTIAVHLHFSSYVERRLSEAGHTFDQPCFEIFFDSLSGYDTLGRDDQFAPLGVANVRWIDRPSQTMVSVLERRSLELYKQRGDSEYWVLEVYSHDWERNTDWTWTRALLVTLDGTGRRTVHRQFFVVWP